MPHAHDFVIVSLDFSSKFSMLCYKVNKSITFFHGQLELSDLLTDACGVN